MYRTDDAHTPPLAFLSRMGGAVLRHVLLLQRDVPAAARFYSEGLGLAVNVCTERWAELQSGPTRLGLKGVDGCVAGCLCGQPCGQPARADCAHNPDGTHMRSEAALTAGYTPFLSFAVADVSATVARCLSLGAVLDGAIKYPAPGGGAKVAALRAPDGHMIGLVEEQP